MWSAHPAFEVLSPWLPDEDRPDPARLNAIVERATQHRRPRTRSGTVIRFEYSIAGPKPKALEYERAIHDTGHVALRPHDWHDAFNALCWIAWPHLKAEINRIHVLHGRQSSAKRGAVRDALTLLDESGVLVLSADEALSMLLMQRRWKQLFVDHRDDVARSMRFLACGHALFDKLRAPYPSITGRALILSTPAVIVGETIDTQRRYAEAMSCATILRHVEAPPPTVALPIAGIPGWNPANAEEAFYDDAAIFRP